MDDSHIAPYLARIGAERPAKPDLDGLRALQRAHLRAVPFENLSVHLGEPIVLDEESLFEKVVGRNRGGFCYELNGLFAALLRALGYQVSLLACRVRGSDGSLGIPYDHLTLRVDLDEPWLADVGFGSFADEPLRLDARGPQHDPAGTFQIEESDGHLEVREADGGFRADPRPAELADFTAGCWWHQTSPDSHFVRSLTCSRRTGTGRVTLSGARLIVTEDGERAETVLEGDEAVLAAYRDHFGITLARVPTVREATAGGLTLPSV